MAGGGRLKRRDSGAGVQKGSGLGRYRCDGRPLLSDHRFNRRRVPLCKRGGPQRDRDKPGPVPFTTEETVVKDLQGLSLRNVEVVIRDGKKELYRDFGEMLFTHFGVSGPVLLSASSYIAKRLKKGNVTLSIDLKPALSAEQLDARILRDFDEAKNRQYKNALNHLLPSKLIPVMIERSGISPEKQVNEITREERKRLAEAVKSFTLTINGLRGFNEAIITQGGITVKEVNPSTMESKLLKKLYFAGEVLDLDAVTGGFNLQIAWSTGVLAGRSAAGED